MWTDCCQSGINIHTPMATTPETITEHVSARKIIHTVFMLRLLMTKSFVTFVVVVVMEVAVRREMKPSCSAATGTESTATALDAF